MNNLDNNSALRNLAALVDFSNLINSSLSIEFTINNLLLTCFTKFFVTRGIVFVVNNDEEIIVGSSKGIDIGNYSAQKYVPGSGISSNDCIQQLVVKNNLIFSKEIISDGKIRGELFFGEKINKQPFNDEDVKFLDTILRITSTALENALFVEKIKNVNRELDNKVNQLASLFDLSKEFGGILDENVIAKLVAFSVIGQLFISRYAIVSYNGGFNIIDSRFDKNQLTALLEKLNISEINSPVCISDDEKENDFYKLGVKLIIPMLVKNKLNGLILLGKRINQVDYSKSDIEFTSSVGSLAAMAIENSILFKTALEKEKIEKDLELAKKIQQNLLPQKFPKLQNFEIVAVNKSARQVGGDYYDIVKLPQQKTLFAIGDVSGKGVQAALIMANTQAFLKSICKQNLPLDAASNLLNDLLAENTTNGGFVTFFWGIIDDQTKELTYVNAGHNPPLLVRDKKIEKLKKGGMILGVMPTLVPYCMTTIQLQKDDWLVLFTDGITEAMSIENEEYSDDRLEKLILNTNVASAGELLQTMLNDVEIFTNGAEQSDDITSLIIKVN